MMDKITGIGDTTHRPEPSKTLLTDAASLLSLMFGKGATALPRHGHIPAVSSKHCKKYSIINRQTKNARKSYRKEAMSIEPGRLARRRARQGYLPEESVQS